MFSRQAQVEVLKGCNCPSHVMRKLSLDAGCSEALQFHFTDLWETFLDRRRDALANGRWTLPCAPQPRGTTTDINA